MENVNAELRRNPVSGTVVIIATGREKGLDKLRRVNPRDWSGFNQKIVSGTNCPFCSGCENLTPPEVKAYRANPETRPDYPGWSVRVVPNIGPAVDQSFPGVMLEERQVGQFLVTEGFGYHYVVIETVEHVSHMADSDQRNMHDVVSMWRDMTNTTTGDRSVRYVAIFQNYGPLAGASQPHRHSQIVGLPVIPPRIRNELRGAERFFAENKECFYCRDIRDELTMGTRIVQESKNFLAWCPFTSKTPYQVVITPREHQSYFANISTHKSADRLTEFACLLKDVLKRIKVTLNDPDHNLYIHTSPANQPEMDHYHWHCQIEPVTTAIMAGFEKGFGVFLNPRSPESAAADLRAAIIT